jgi:hypothetical protein
VRIGRWVLENGRNGFAAKERRISGGHSAGKKLGAQTK